MVSLTWLPAVCEKDILIMNLKIKISVTGFASLLQTLHRGGSLINDLLKLVEQVHPNIAVWLSKYRALCIMLLYGACLLYHAS